MLFVVVVVRFFVWLGFLLLFYIIRRLRINTALCNALSLSLSLSLSLGGRSGEGGGRTFFRSGMLHPYIADLVYM